MSVIHPALPKSTSRDAIVVLQASVTHDDPGEIVGSNVWFVNALRDEYLTTDEIASDAMRSYLVDYYLAQVNNGGFSQFVDNSRWGSLTVRRIREGLRAMGATRHLAVFDQGTRLVDPPRTGCVTWRLHRPEHRESFSRDFSIATRTRSATIAVRAPFARLHQPETSP